MTLLQKSVQNDLERIPSFQETYQRSYSHGLEAIYTLEHVDIKSVRKLVALPEKRALDDTKTAIKEFFEDQLTFDLGPFFRGWMVPHLIQEPIQVLQLSKHVEKLLLEKKISTLGALREVNFSDTVFLKGLGQGNIEDVRKKLENYVEAKSVQRSVTIDFISLLKCLCADLDRKKTYALLEPYGLAEWLFLAPVEGAELKKLKPDLRQEWIQEVTATVLTGDKLKFLTKELQLLIDTWIVPWLWRRGGYATEEQIYEALYLRSASPRIAEQAISLLFSWIPLKAFLKHADGVYAASEEDITCYQELLKIARSYFVHPHTHYSVTELEGLIAKEFAQKWRSPPVFQALRLSSLFHFYRDRKGQWQLTKSDLLKFSVDRIASAGP